MRLLLYLIDLVNICKRQVKFTCFLSSVSVAKQPVVSCNLAATGESLPPLTPTARLSHRQSPAWLSQLAMSELLAAGQTADSDTMAVITLLPSPTPST